MSNHVRIVFICSGNICRSPMAEAIAQEVMEERGVAGAVISAGTLGISGRKPSSTARKALEEREIDPPGTLSQGISPPLMEHADHIAVMAPKHRDYLLENVPAVSQRLVLLWEYADRPLEEISDPVGENLETFRRTRDLLYECIENWLDDLLDEPSE